MTGHLDGFASLEEAADAIAAYNPHRPRPKDLSGLAKNLRQREDGRWVWHWDPAFVSGKFGSADETRASVVQPDRLERAVDALRIPTLLVRGRRSDLLSEEGAREFLARVPHAEYADVAGAGHMVAGDRNEVFNRAILGFLAAPRLNRQSRRPSGPRSRRSSSSVRSLRSAIRCSSRRNVCQPRRRSGCRPRLGAACPLHELAQQLDQGEHQRRPRHARIGDDPAVSPAPPAPHRRQRRGRRRRPLGSVGQRAVVSHRAPPSTPAVVGGHGGANSAARGSATTAGPGRPRRRSTVVGRGSRAVGGQYRWRLSAASGQVA